MPSSATRSTTPNKPKIWTAAGAIAIIGVAFVIASPFIFPDKSAEADFYRRAAETQKQLDQVHALTPIVTGPDDPEKVAAAIKAVGWPKGRYSVMVPGKSYALLSLLCAAADKGNQRIVAYLLKNGYGTNPESLAELLDYAVALDKMDTVHYLIENHYITDSGQMTPAVYSAADRGDSALLRYLLDHGGRVSGLDEFGNPFLIDNLPDDPDTLRLLLERGASINAAITRDPTPISYSGRPDPKRVELVNDVNGKGITALMRAAIWGRKPGVIQVLLEHGADPTLKSASGKTALDFARKYNHPEIVRLLEAAPKPDDAGKKTP